MDGFTVQEFKALYRADPFYSWIGLDTDRMYSAHRAAGGMTSVYRQIGIGCERLFRAVITDSAEYTAPEFATWSYSTKTPSGKNKTLSLDGRLMLSQIRNDAILKNVQSWINIYCEGLAEVTYPEMALFLRSDKATKARIASVKTPILTMLPSHGQTTICQFSPFFHLRSTPTSCYDIETIDAEF